MNTRVVQPDAIPAPWTVGPFSAAHSFVLNVRVHAQKWPLRVPRRTLASDGASASCPSDAGKKAPASWSPTATPKRGHVAQHLGTTSSATKHRSQAPSGSECGSTRSRGLLVPRTRYRTAEAAPSIHPAPTHQPPFHSTRVGAALGACLSPLSQLLLLLLALGLLEEAELFFKSLQSFDPLLDHREMPVKRNEGS